MAEETQQVRAQGDVTTGTEDPVAPAPGGLRGRLRGVSPLTFGVILLLVTAAIAVGLFFKPTIETALRPGDTISAELPENYLGKIFEGETTVKLSGIEVGTVVSLDETPRRTAMVVLKLDHGVLDELGPQPSATITARTLLGGLYSIELIPGGGRAPFPEDGVIPLERTSLPVGLERILETLPRPTRQAVQGVVGSTESALSAGSTEELRRLLTQGPPALAPANDVLQAVRGTRPGVDLPQLVGNLEATAQTITRHDGELGSIVDDLGTTTRVLGRQSAPVADAIRTMPETLRVTRAGLGDLKGTLERLTGTAEAFGPSAKALDPALAELAPVLEKARPLASDLRALLPEARPVVQKLVPVSDKATNVLSDVRGPVLDRVRGPVLDTLLNTFDGSKVVVKRPGKEPYTPYGGDQNDALNSLKFEPSGQGYQADHKFYEELAFLVSNLDRGSSAQDANGSLLNFQVGAGPLSTPQGYTQLNFANLVDQLTDIAGAGGALGRAGGPAPTALPGLPLAGGGR